MYVQMELHTHTHSYSILGIYFWLACTYYFHLTSSKQFASIIQSYLYTKCFEKRSVTRECTQRTHTHKHINDVCVHQIYNVSLRANAYAITDTHI